MARMMLRAVQLDRQIVIVLAIAMTVIGIYSINTRMFDVATALGFGVIGYFMLRYGYPTAAAALGVFLGREFERSLRIGLNMNDNSYVEFFTRPITMGIIAVAIALLAWGTAKRVQLNRRMAETERAGGGQL
jgi:putative tricarboxylic transport membrane protein